MFVLHGYGFNSFWSIIVFHIWDKHLLCLTWWLVGFNLVNYCLEKCFHLETKTDWFWNTVFVLSNNCRISGKYVSAMIHMSNHLKNITWIHEATRGNVYSCESTFYSLHYKIIFMQDKICTKPLLDFFLTCFQTHISIILKERIPHISNTPTPLWKTHTFFMPAKHKVLKIRWNMFPQCLFLQPVIKNKCYYQFNTLLFLLLISL
jgi:hypothetical protein